MRKLRSWCTLLSCSSGDSSPRVVLGSEGSEEVVLLFEDDAAQGCGGLGVCVQPALGERGGGVLLGPLARGEALGLREEPLDHTGGLALSHM